MIQILYLLASFIAVAATIPQVKQLLITKESDELSLSSWSTWGVCQVMASVYAASIGAWPYVIVSTAWVAFYVVMVFLIIKYRRPVIKYKQQRALRDAVPVTVQDSSRP